MGHREIGDDDPVRRAAQYRVERETARERGVEGGHDEAGPGPEAEPPVDGGPPRPRMDDRSRWVDTVIDQAIRRGEFDDLPLAGKPIPGLKGTHDPDWWLKNLVEREQITGVLPSAQLRQEDAELDALLDRQSSPDAVREIVEDFNARVVDARRQLLGGPPVLTPTRDVERELTRWRERRRYVSDVSERGGSGSRTPAAPGEGTTDARRTARRWWRRPRA
jgi:hypothetical protein